MLHSHSPQNAAKGIRTQYGRVFSIANTARSKPAGRRSLNGFRNIIGFLFCVALVSPLITGCEGDLSENPVADLGGPHQTKTDHSVANLDNTSSNVDAYNVGERLNQPLQIITNSLPEGRIGNNYSASMMATGGQPPYQWKLAGGTLPPGLNLNAAGTLSGLPEDSGLFTLSIEVWDSGGGRVQTNLQIKIIYVILLTGFGPFGSHATNPSWESIKPLDGFRVGDYEVRIQELPVEWDTSANLLFARLDKDHPAMVISSGLDDSATKMRLEKNAKNYQSGKDNQGVLKNGPCIADGPSAYQTRLPLVSIQQALSSSVGSYISSDAGSYLCNHVFYHLMHRVEPTSTIAGFIHVPLPQGTLKLEHITEAWKNILQAVTQNSGAAETLQSQTLIRDTIHSPPVYRGIETAPR